MKPKVPICAACGRPLRKPRHLVCGEMPNGEITVDGKSPTRGDYGDNLVCTQVCGWRLAVRIVAAIPGVLDLLPEQWQPKRMATIGSKAWWTESQQRRRAK